MFEKFPSLTRFSHGWTITEKLDGTNAQVIIAADDDPKLLDALRFQETRDAQLASVHGFSIFAGSRSKLIYPGKSTDNHGFGGFVQQNAPELISTLGEGRHFGEWVGKGINARGYNLDQKVFALFNTARWTDVELPDRVRVVPVLFEGYADNPGLQSKEALDGLKNWGSIFAPGFMDPEGIVMRHGPSGTLFKKTFDYDEQGKWAENQARKSPSVS